MTHRKSRLFVVGLVVMLGLTGASACAFVSSFLGPPSTDALGFSVQMVPVDVAPDVLCLNTETKGPKALELIHPLKAMIVIQGGERQLAQDRWKDFSPSPPWIKNQDIQNLYESHCHYRSPGAPPDCEGWECARYEEVSGYTWRTLGNIRATGCYPKEGGACERVNAEPGSLAVILVEKCHVIRVKSPTLELTDPEGNKFVMNAHAAAKPSTEVEIPEGWRFDVVNRAEPLEVKPFGGGDACFHVLLNDSKKQFYHQFVDVDGVFP